MRVIAGRFKGRRLKAPTWDGLRPTSDKLRETLFNILAPRIEGARVLDGYAGTGAVGIEALSRGAAHVTFVEQDRRAVALIEANSSARADATARAILSRAATSSDAAARVRAPFDVIWLDPPYDSDSAAALEAAADASRLAACWCSSAPRGASPRCRPRWRVRDVKSGDSTLTFFTRTPDV